MTPKSYLNHLRKKISIKDELVRLIAEKQAEEDAEVFRRMSLMVETKGCIIIESLEDDDADYDFAIRG